MSTAIDEDVLLFEFLSEEVPCETYDEAETHGAEVYGKLSCVHCGHAVIWPTCMPHWNKMLVFFLVHNTILACKICGKDIVLLDRSEIVGPVR